MGTQFWWFYDVLTLTIAAGLLYNAVTRGFNKMVFQLVGFILALVVGVFGSDALANQAYTMVFQDTLTASIRMKYETVDLYEMTAQAVQQNPAEDAPETVDAVLVQQTAELISAGETAPAWFVQAVAEAAENSLLQQISPLPEKDLNTYFTEDPAGLRAFLKMHSSGDVSAAACLEEQYIRPYYLELVRMALFLMLEVMILIIVGIISGMAGNLEQQMHIRKFNRILAVPVGLIQTACILITFAVAVKLITAATDNMMMLFNQETIAKTKIFQFIYQLL